MAQPPFLIEIAIQPASPSERERLHEALDRLAKEDGALAVGVDPESGLSLLKGSDERRLQQTIAKLLQSSDFQIEVGTPQVAYRETLGRPAPIDHTYKRQDGQIGQFARVRLLFEPAEPGAGFRFDSAIVGGAIPAEFIPAVQMGIESASQMGLLAGFPVIDFKATLLDGAFHDVDSSALTFEIASRAAFHQLRREADVKLIEPIMDVEVLTADDYLDTVLADLRARRGEVREVRRYRSTNAVLGWVPLAHMLGYAWTLLTKSGGRAQARMTFSHYSPIPEDSEPDPRFPTAMAMRA